MKPIMLLTIGIASLACSLFLRAATARPIPYQQPGGIADLEDPFIASGYNALFTCSAHFVARRPLADIKVVELADTIPLGLPDPVIDSKNMTVRVGTGETARIAAYRHGMGCTLLPPQWGIADVPRLPYVQYREPVDLSLVPWPLGDNYSVKKSTRLTDVLSRAFDGNSFGANTLTVSVIVLKDDVVIAEQYRDGFGPYSGYRTWSTAKSITGVLIGIATGQGLLDPEQPAPVPEWQAPGDARKNILLKELLWMSSGLYGGGNNTAAVYFGGQDVISAVTTTQLEVDPGTRWKYANNDTLLALRALRHQLDDDLAYLRFPYDELLHPIGMHHTYMETDHQGNFIGSSQVYTTARDLARFGLLLVNDGVWLGRRILPAGWIDFVSTPAATRPTEAGKQGYGAQFWLFGAIDGLPADTFTSAGNKGQYVTVIRSADVVVVRTGVDPAGARWNQPRFTKAVLKRI